MGVVLEMMRPPGELTFVLTLPVAVGFRITSISTPDVACSSDMRISVFGTQGTLVPWRHTWAPTFCLAFPRTQRRYDASWRGELAPRNRKWSLPCCHSGRAAAHIPPGFTLSWPCANDLGGGLAQTEHPR
jgi:hypothetical protein